MYIPKVIVRDEAVLRKIRRDTLGRPRQYQHGDPEFSVPQYPAKSVAHPAVDVIFRAMHQRRITYNEIKDKTGIAYNTLWAWKTNKQSPRVSQLEKVYKVLGIRWRVYIPGIDN